MIARLASVLLGLVGFGLIVIGAFEPYRAVALLVCAWLFATFALQAWKAGGK